MTTRLTLAADASAVAALPSALPSGVAARPMTDADAEALAHLYLAAYGASGGVASLDDAREEMRATFAGDFGSLWPAASPLAMGPSGEPVAAVMTVPQAPADWLAPGGPFVIEVFTHSAWRGRGLASALLASAARAVVASGGTTLALRVDPANVGAMRVYAALGFVGVGPDDRAAVREALGAG